MLAAVIRNSGLDEVFDAVLSVEEVGVYKPHPSVYALATQHLELARQTSASFRQMAYAFSAKAFGFRVLWCNRFSQAAERIPATPDGEIGDLSSLPDLLFPSSQEDGGKQAGKPR